jgi:hypothetical protein
MVSVLAWSVVYRGFEPLSGKTKDYKIGIYCFSTMHDALRRKSNRDLLLLHYARCIKEKEQRLVASESE